MTKKKRECECEVPMPKFKVSENGVYAYCTNCGELI